MTLISIFIQDYKNKTTIHNTIPLAYLSYLKVSKQIPFISKNTQKILESLLPSIKEEAIGLYIEVESKDVYVKMEVIYADIHSI